MLVLNVLTPVFLLIALGTVLQKTAFVSPGFLREANRVTYWLGLPALLFSQLATSMHDASAASGLFTAVLAGTGLLVALAYGTGVLLRVPGPAMGTFVQGAFRGNLAFVGLPIVYSLPETTLRGGISLRAAAVLVVAPTMVLYNIAGIVVLQLSQHRFGVRMLWPFVKQLLSTPPLLATIAGVMWAFSGWPLPPAVGKALESLGEMALPLGLLGVGGALVTVKLGANWRSPLAAALLKTVASPLCGWLMARGLGLGAEETGLVLIFMAAPTAIVSYTMAVELKGDETLASGTIVLSVLASLVVLAAIIALH